MRSPSESEAVKSLELARALWEEAIRLPQDWKVILDEEGAITLRPPRPITVLEALKVLQKPPQ